MAHVTVAVRRTIVGLLTLVGGYYAFVGASVLLNLGQVTRRWTQLSGDPDVPADAGQFVMLIGAGAAIWIVLGVATVLFFGELLRRRIRAEEQALGLSR